MAFSPYASFIDRSQSAGRMRCPPAATIAYVGGGADHKLSSLSPS
jgi:hypothetical protein